jgi:hypothetical protein
MSMCRYGWYDGPQHRGDARALAYLDSFLGPDYNLKG